MLRAMKNGRALPAFRAKWQSLGSEDLGGLDPEVVIVLWNLAGDK